MNESHKTDQFEQNQRTIGDDSRHREENQFGGRRRAGLNRKFESHQQGELYSIMRRSAGHSGALKMDEEKPDFTYAKNDEQKAEPAIMASGEGSRFWEEEQ